MIDERSDAKDAARAFEPQYAEKLPLRESAAEIALAFAMARGSLTLAERSSCPSGDFASTPKRPTLLSLLRECEKREDMRCRDIRAERGDVCVAYGTLGGIVIRGKLDCESKSAREDSRGHRGGMSLAGVYAARSKGELRR